MKDIQRKFRIEGYCIRALMRNNGTLGRMKEPCNCVHLRVLAENEDEMCALVNRTKCQYEDKESHYWKKHYSVMAPGYTE